MATFAGLATGFLASVALAALAAWLMLPLFRRYALARPNHRSSHREPTPQGGGIAILIGSLGVWLATGLAGVLPGLPVIAGALAIGALGAWDDLSPLSWRLRLGLQIAILAMVLASLPEAWRVLPMLPLWVERAVALLLGLWFVNLVNFMDGIDGLLVIGLAPALLAIGTGLFGLLPVEPLAALLAGALCGFLVLNRPKAMLFAGDVGSLSVALVTAVLLYRFAAAHSLSAAIILPLYFVMDATHTLLMRALRRANLAEAHRDHAYQHALDAGMPAARIIGEVLLLNAFLAMLAACATTTPGFDVLWLALALATTGGLIVRFRGRERR